MISGLWRAIQPPPLRSPTRWIAFFVVPIFILLLWAFRHTASGEHHPLQAIGWSQPPGVVSIPHLEFTPTEDVEEQGDSGPVKVDDEPAATESSTSHYLQGNWSEDSVETLSFVKPLPTVVSVPAIDTLPTGTSVSDDLPSATAEAEKKPHVNAPASDPKLENPIGHPEEKKPGPHQAFEFSDEDEKRLPACALVPKETLQQLRGTKDISVHTFANGAQAEEATTLAAPVSLCILVSVEQKRPPSKLYNESPVLGKWPDTIHLHVKSEDLAFSIPPLRSLPAQPNAHRLFSKQAILYYAELQLKHEGLYKIHVEQEFWNWNWAQHGWGEASNKTLRANRGELRHMHSLSAVEKFVATKQINKLSLDNVKVPAKKKFPPRLKVSAAPTLPSLPPCYKLPELDANRGRWYDQQKFSSLRKETADEFGYSFDLDDCHLEYFNDRDTIDCFENKIIHVYGDSNARRLSRTILSGGRWCHNVSDKCQGEDWGSPVNKIFLNKKGKIVERLENGPHKASFDGASKNPFLFGKNSQLWFTFLTSVAYQPAIWLRGLYKPADLNLSGKGSWTQAFKPSNIVDGAKARSPKRKGKADLVIASMSSWDDAFDAQYRRYDTAIKWFRQAILEAYPDPETRVVLRLNQGYCCRNHFRPTNMRRFTGTRLQHFGDIARNAFKVIGGKGMDGRVSVVDVSALTGRPEVVGAYTKGQRSSNHQRAAHVRTEAQILLNTVCERDGSGKAVWKRS